MKLSALYLYPIKSAAAVSLEVAEVDELGISGDRRLMVVDKSGRMMTQRSVPTLALVQPRFEGDEVVVTAPGMPELRIPRRCEQGEPLRVVVWGDWVDAIRIDREADRWFSQLLARDVRLAYMPHTTFREVDRKYGGAGKQVSFADGFPFLLTTEASLADLNARMAAPLPMNRFRPNLVVSGSEPWAEDGWKKIRVGTVRFDVVKPCARCVITTVDQVTGAIGKEPLATLSTFRQVDSKVLFGQNLVHRNRGHLRIGDPVELG
ncbi:MAG: MOSC domain-containing protein [Deltaproteobacteria bacterium]|nr:MAG: MOSC domain-containing protein [Deltaproteobacteria bacterium]